MTTPNQPSNGRSSSGAGATRRPDAAQDPQDRAETASDTTPSTAPQPQAVDGRGQDGPAPQLPAHQGPRPPARPRPPQQSSTPPWQRGQGAPGQAGPGQPPQGQPGQGQPPQQAGPGRPVPDAQRRVEPPRTPEPQRPSEAQRPEAQRPPEQQRAPEPQRAPEGQRPSEPQRAPEGQRSPEPQRQPQTNLQQRPAAAGQAPYSAPSGVDEATRAARKEESRSKAAVIDGPTRNIARNDLPTDMPDLSSVSHPTPEAPAGATAAAVAVPAGDGSPLRAMVQLRRIDPWSMLKLSLVISVSLFFVWMVAVGLLYLVLDGMGVWDRLNNAFTDIVASSGDSGLVSAGQIFGYAAVIGLINVVLFTALTTIGSFIYNLCSDLVGGLEVTLADRD